MDDDELPPMLDSLAKLEISIRPQSVPSWINSDEHHAPKASSFPSRTTHGDDTLASSVRPRAPILPLPKPTADPEIRPRAKRMTSFKRKIKQSLTESLKSLESFGRTNLGRELGHKHAIMQTVVDPEGTMSLSAQELLHHLHAGNVHFVNIDGLDDSCDSLSIDDDEWKPFGRKMEPIESPTGRVFGGPSACFDIPELPRGQRCVFNILSTWGDPYYGNTYTQPCFGAHGTLSLCRTVGLMGIEIFDHTGHLVRLSDVDKQLSADPADLNVNSPMTQDPRTIDKIVDGHNYTCDELHAWLAPFERGQNHYIYMDLDYPVSIAMMRIWNYNTTRIHSYRGARYMEISLDGRFIFKGDIKRAVGAVDSMEACCECILFTRNPSILQVIEKYEQKEDEATPRALAPATDGPEKRHLSWWQQDIPAERPKTGEKRGRQKDMLSIPTSISGLCEPSSGMRQPATFAPAPALSPFRPRTAPIAREKGADRPVMCQEMKLFIKGNWGDPTEVGLTGLEILDANFDTIPIDVDCLLPPSVLVLISSNNISTDADDMWLTPLETEPSIVINFGLRLSVGALKIWNYNASLEDSYKGVKRLAIMMDGDWMSPPEGFLIRKAPGNSNFDFGQFVQPKSPHHASSTVLTRSIGGDFFQTEPFAHSPPPTADPKRMSSQRAVAPRHETRESKAASSAMPKIDETLLCQQYHTPLFPCGCIVKIVVMSTWGDPFYVGLNGLALYDAQNMAVPIGEDQIQAVPRDINVLPESKDSDVRTLDKLYDGINNTYDDCHMWLTPFNYSSETVKIFIFFDEPIVLSKLMLWNYSKTPARGVREFEVMMDDVLIYHGVLRKAQECSDPDLRRRANNGATSRRKAHVPDMATSVLFTNDADVLEAESDAGHVYVPEEECETTFIDNSHVLPAGEQLPTRPPTSAGPTWK